jgi:hypothetical protein
VRIALRPFLFGGAEAALAPLSQAAALPGSDRGQRGRERVRGAVPRPQWEAELDGPLRASFFSGPSARTPFVMRREFGGADAVHKRISH